MPHAELWLVDWFSKQRKQPSTGTKPDLFDLLMWGVIQKYGTRLANESCRKENTTVAELIQESELNLTAKCFNRFKLRFQLASTHHERRSNRIISSAIGGFFQKCTLLAIADYVWVLLPLTVYLLYWWSNKEIHVLDGHETRITKVSRRTHDQDLRPCNTKPKHSCTDQYQLDFVNFEASCSCHATQTQWLNNKNRKAEQWSFL